MQQQDSLLVRIRVVIEALPLASRETHHVAHFAHMIALFSGKTHIARPRSFQLVSRDATRDEIARISSMLRDLMTAIDSLHGTAIDVLAENDLLHAVRGMAPLLKALPDALDHVDYEATPERAKAGPRGIPGVVALTHVLAGSFSALTGKKPTSTLEGPFHVFVEEIFSVLNVTHSAEHYVKVVLSDRRERSQRAN